MHFKIYKHALNVNFKWLNYLHYHQISTHNINLSVQTGYKFKVHKVQPPIETHQQTVERRIEPDTLTSERTKMQNLTKITLVNAEIMHHARLLLNRQEFGSWYLSYSGSMRSWRLRLLIFVGSATLKNFGAKSASHLGSIAITSRMYSLVVITNSL